MEHFIKSIVKQNLKYREEHCVIRNDFFQLLVQLRNSSTVEMNDQWHTVIKGDENQKTMSLNEVAAQTFIFFAAGFETSSSTLTYCLYELARNQDVQGKLHNEIDGILERNNGHISYECLSEMKYLECCIDGV